MSTPTIESAVARVRSYNRFFTRLIGVLDESLLHSRYSLTEVRVLFELRHHAPISATELRRRLGLDAGYLSRILARFTSEGLAERTPSPDDARVHAVWLSPAGRAEFELLDAKSNDQIERLLTPLGPAATREVVQAMDTIQGHLGMDCEVAPPPVIVREPGPGELGWIIARNGALYAQERGWNGEYEALVAQVVSRFATEHDRDTEAAWIADIGGAPVGAIMCARGDEPETAKLRVLHVEPSARGRGVGTLLIEQCLQFARRAGYRRMTLWTVSCLHSAIRLYQRAGFTCDTQQPVTMFGHDLTAQTWSREL